MFKYMTNTITRSLNKAYPKDPTENRLRYYLKEYSDLLRISHIYQVNCTKSLRGRKVELCDV